MRAGQRLAAFWADNILHNACVSANRASISRTRSKLLVRTAAGTLFCGRSGRTARLRPGSPICHPCLIGMEACVGARCILGEMLPTYLARCTVFATSRKVWTWSILANTLRPRRRTHLRAFLSNVRCGGEHACCAELLRPRVWRPSRNQTHPEAMK
jgi:hypothetical protein